MSDVVETRQGTLTGTVEEGVRVYRGVPFATPPVGPLRFRPPAPPAPWAGARPATRSGPSSWQVNRDNLQKVQQIVASFGDHFPGVRLAPPFAAGTYVQPVIGEDCLYLDMWVPERAPGELLPVFVYFHGGANVGSAGSNPLERGSRLAREERVIVVRPNYRMGALGWVHFGLVSDDLGDAVNLGVRDQIAALRWVAANVERFGGDPEAITVGGESAGATAVSHLLTNPDTRPLFRRAILQSFTPFNQWATQRRQDAVAVAEIYLQILGIADPRELLTIDPDRLLAVGMALQRFFDADKNCAWRPLGAVVDGTVVPQLPGAYLSTADLGSVDLAVMIGFAKDEWQFFRGHSRTLQSGTEDDFLRILGQACGPGAALDLLAAYQELHPDHPAPQLIGDAMSFEFFKLPSLRIAANLARQGIPTHAFQFSYDLPGAGGHLRAYHTGDTPFIWRTLDPEDLARWPAFDGVDPSSVRRSAAAFGARYGAFLREGDPGPDWPRFDGHETVLWFGEDVEARPRLLSGELTAFDKAGIGDVPALEERLAGATRASLGVPARALAGPRR